MTIKHPLATPSSIFLLNALNYIATLNMILFIEINPYYLNHSFPAFLNDENMGAETTECTRIF